MSSEIRKSQGIGFRYAINSFSSTKLPLFIDRKAMNRTPKTYYSLAYLPYIYARFYNRLIIKHIEVPSKLAYFGPREENFETTAKMKAENGKFFRQKNGEHRFAALYLGADYLHLRNFDIVGVPVRRCRLCSFWRVCYIVSCFFLHN